MKFSANLGFLWSGLALPDAIRAAKSAGFDAVECHWPYATPANETLAALQETGLPMLGLNTPRGDVAAGENGLSALIGRDSEARAAIDLALEYARRTGTRAVHVMAGNASGPGAHAAFVANLAYACKAAAQDGIKILIEPLNPYNAPGYFLNSTAQAAAIIREVSQPNLALMFDCFHVQIIEGDITRRLAALLPIIGHIQIAAVPDRGAPDHGELDYAYVLTKVAQLGWRGAIGAEYTGADPCAPQLGWLTKYRETLHKRKV